jgi:hypothetical protein
MRPRQYTITRRTVHVYAEYVCQRYIRLKDHGPKCKASVLWALLFWAATRISSLAAACAALRAAPSDTAAHDALLATLPPSRSCSAASTAPCRATCPRPCAAVGSPWPST